MITSQTRFDFAKANGAKRIDKDNPFWLCIACLSIGVIIGFTSGWWFSSRDGLHVKNVSDETIERIRLGIENIRLQRELNERSKEVVP